MGGEEVKGQRKYGVGLVRLKMCIGEVVGWRREEVVRMRARANGMVWGWRFAIMNRHSYNILSIMQCNHECIHHREHIERHI